MVRPHPLAFATYRRRFAEACAKVAGLDYAIGSLVAEDAVEWLPHVQALRAAEADIAAAMLALSSAWERDDRVNETSYEDALARIADELNRIGVIKRD